MKNKDNIFWGVLLIVIGLLVFLKSFDLLDFEIFFDGWWTLFIIVPSAIGLFKKEDKAGNVVGLGIGVLLLLSCQDILEFKVVWKLIIPILLIGFGVSILFKDNISKKVKEEIKKKQKNDVPNYFASFGGQDVNLANEEFAGCDINAIFGAVTLDLRESKIKDDVLIKATSIFGGIDIMVPKDVKVKVNALPIFGGVSNERHNPDGKVKTIYVDATALFGGVEIK